MSRRGGSICCKNREKHYTTDEYMLKHKNKINTCHCCMNDKGCNKFLRMTKLHPPDSIDLPVNEIAVIYHNIHIYVHNSRYK